MGSTEKSVRSATQISVFKNGPSCHRSGPHPGDRRLLGLQRDHHGPGSGIDARLFLVVAPILAAVSWAAFNIGRAAVGLSLIHI